MSAPPLPPAREDKADASSKPPVSVRHSVTQPGDTPPSKANITTRGMATRGAHVNEAALKDVGGGALMCTLKAFIDALLSKHTPHITDDAFENSAKAVYEQLTETLYDANNKRWKAFPTGVNGSERLYYAPLVELFNTICNHPQLDRLRGMIKDTLCGFWLNTSNHAPDSVDKSSARIRPDLSWLLCRAGGRGKLEEIINTIDKLQNEAGKPLDPNATNKRKDGEEEQQRQKEETRKTSLREHFFLAWMHTIMIVEVKPDRELTKEIIIQVVTYLRQIMKDQQDRQFAFALLLLHDKLILWYCDRTGLVGTSEAINIHQEPTKFIEVMIRLMTMSAYDLGWDRTMKIVPSRGKQGQYTPAVHSWDKSLEVGHLPTARHDLRFEIKIGNSTYLILQSLSSSRAEVLSGRATLVWEAIDVGQGRSDGQVDRVIVKQSWGPCGPKSTPEADIYTAAGRSSELVNYEHVPGTRTLQDLRRGLDAISITQYFEKIKPPASAHLPERRDEQTAVHIPQDLQSKWPPAEPLIDRQLYRIVLKQKGIPLKYSKDLKELLRAFSGALDDYQQMYERHGVCHRDISIGNILVVPGKGGILIDLDHAKVEEKYKPTTLRDLIESGHFSKEIKYMLEDDATGRKRQAEEGKYPLRPALDARSATLLLHLADLNVTIQELTQSESEDPPTPLYLAQHYTTKIWADWKSNHNPTENTPSTFSALLAHELGIDVDRLVDIVIPPTFLKHEPRTPWATGTPGFISHALLGDSPAPIHLAIHDMESFFSTLLYLGLTREGCGAKRRDEYPPTMDNAEAAKNLFWRICRMRYLWYENDTKEMKDTKALIFKDTSLFTERVLVHLSEYFEPVKPLLLEWYLILQKAFHRRAGRAGILYNFPITAFRAALDKQLETIPELPNSPLHAKYIEMRADEEKRRKDYDDAIEKDILQLKKDHTASTSKVTPTRDSAKQKNAPTYGVSPSSFVPDEPAGDGADVPIPEQDGAAPDNFFPNFLNRASPVSPSPAPKRPRLAPNRDS